MIELREALSQIFLLDFVFAVGSWCWVLAQAAAKNKRGRYVIKHAFYSAGYMVVLGCITATMAIVSWTVYDLFKGVWW